MNQTELCLRLRSEDAMFEMASNLENLSDCFRRKLSPSDEIRWTLSWCFWEMRAGVLESPAVAQGLQWLIEHEAEVYGALCRAECHSEWTGMPDRIRYVCALCVQVVERINGHWVAPHAAVTDLGDGDESSIAGEFDD
jgi:hypothetical protein